MMLEILVNCNHVLTSDMSPEPYAVFEPALICQHVLDYGHPFVFNCWLSEVTGWLLNELTIVFWTTRSVFKWL